MRRTMLSALALAAFLPKLAFAVPIAFEIAYSSAPGGGSSGGVGSASAVAVIDDSIFDLPVGQGPDILRLRTDDGTFDALTQLELTISGVGNPANNGVFTLSDLDFVFFTFSQRLDPTQELLSQFTRTGPGSVFDFGFESAGLGLQMVNLLVFETSGGMQNPDGSFEFDRTQFRIESITPIGVIPEPSTGLLLGLGLCALSARLTHARQAMSPNPNG